MAISKGQISGLASPLLERWRIKKIMKFFKGDRILDYGCGYGKLASLIPDREYVGIDINKDVIELARKTYHHQKNIKFYTLEEFEYKKQFFETIVLAAVLEHVNNPNQLIHTLKCCLSSEGRLIITTPTPLADRILKIGSKIRIFDKEAAEEHKQLFTREDLMDLSSQLNFSVLYYERFELGLNQLVVFGNNEIN
jgi:2-polyprenyl-3-methyl-5-hydroxy-6-metoxy-1,4-benzoquinol methylase